jgi:two-component system KDP operon response regulator KdpE
MPIVEALFPPSQSHERNKSSRPEGKLLIVSEEVHSRRALHAELYRLGFDIAETASWEEALALCRIVPYDAALLDVSRPQKDAIERLTELRRLLPRGVIFMLSVEEDQERKLEALEAGADDYLTKPFHMRELTARIRAALRRVLAGLARQPQVITIGEISLNPAQHIVQKAGCRIHLTPKEFELLHSLMMHHGIPIAHGRLLHSLWGDEYSSQVDCLRTFMCQLRKKIEDDPGAPRYILTESGIGYRFVDPEDWLRRNRNAQVTRAGEDAETEAVNFPARS